MRPLTSALLLAATTFAFSPTRSSAQVPAPLPAGDDVTLTLKTNGDTHQFHLGELIPIMYSIGTRTEGRYYYLENPKPLLGGHALEISCSPPAEPAVQRPDDPAVTLKFDSILTAPCGGVGGGYGGWCTDCDGETLLTPASTTYTAGPLNAFVRFRTAGTYTCQATAANITERPPGAGPRQALLLRSAPLTLSIVADAEWSRTTRAACADTYSSQCEANIPANQQQRTQCARAAYCLALIDTKESLASLVTLFDNHLHKWPDQFWLAIRTSSYPEEALKLMAKRMQDPDFRVTPAIVEWLAAAELKHELPDAFSTDTPEKYHAVALLKLQKYVRLLGESLPRKNPDELWNSMGTYRHFADEPYCEKQPLIPKQEQLTTLQAARSASGNQ